MKPVACLTMLMLVVGLSGPARAQFPFGAPRPEIGKMPQCTKDYRKSVDEQLQVLEKLRSAGPELVGQICALIETGSALIGDELPESTRQQLKGLLGVDVDLRLIKTQCRVAQGNLDREMMTEIGLLKAELQRCGDTI
jgi:hypothetical protein